MDKTPEEHAFDAFLGSRGMTQEEFEALPENEKQALLEEFKEAMKRQIEEETAKKLDEAEANGLVRGRGSRPCRSGHRVQQPQRSLWVCGKESGREAD